MRATCIAVLLVTGLLLTGPPAWADFEEGVTAFKAGDYERAFKSWNPLAERGDRESQLGIGSLYEKGRGVDQDLVEAHKWYVLAWERQVYGAQRRALALRAKLEPAQLRDSNRRTQAWKTAFAARSTPTHTGARGDVRTFSTSAHHRTEDHPANETLRILCSAKIDETHVTFITADRKHVLLVARTPRPLVDPTKDIGIDVKHALRISMPPPPRAGASPSGPLELRLLDITDTGRKTATMDWAYVYDRNGDDFVDYLTHVNGLFPTIPDPRPSNLPPVAVMAHAADRIVTKADILFMVSQVRMQFLHAADDNFDGRSDAYVISTQEDESGWVDGRILLRSTRFDQRFDECRYEPGARGTAPATCAPTARGYRVPGRFFTGFEVVPPPPTLGLFPLVNAAARKCGLTARHFRRE